MKLRAPSVPIITVDPYFSVWAPNARSVSVVCDRNGWDRTKNPMEKYPQTGIWKCFVYDVGYGENYKFSIETSN